MRFFTTGRFSRFGSVFALALALLSLATAPLAVGAADTGNYTASLTVQGGALGMTLGTGSYTASQVTVAYGTVQTTTYQPAINIADQRGLLGTGLGGWHLTITSTKWSTGGGTPVYLTPASGQYIQTINALSGSSATCQSAGSCVQPTNSITSATNVPSNDPAPAAASFFNAATATGAGTSTLSPTITVNVPADAAAGTYTSTVTVSIVAGP